MSEKESGGQFGNREESGKKTISSSTRSSIQLPRRVFHMLSGLFIAMLYLYYMDKNELVTFMGIIASLIFIGEQVRIKYPELSSFFSKVNIILYRAEEQFEVASAMPYAASCLLVIFAFPKGAAIISILFLGLGDPLAALVGIKYGKHKMTPNRSIEGSVAFFIMAFLICFFVIGRFYSNYVQILVFSFVGALIGAISDFIETRLDDNITIPFISASLISLATRVIFGTFV